MQICNAIFHSVCIKCDKDHWIGNSTVCGKNKLNSFRRPKLIRNPSLHNVADSVDKSIYKKVIWLNWCGEYFFLLLFLRTDFPHFSLFYLVFACTNAVLFRDGCADSLSATKNLSYYITTIKKLMDTVTILCDVYI